MNKATLKIFRVDDYLTMHRAVSILVEAALPFTVYAWWQGQWQTQSNAQHQVHYHGCSFASNGKIDWNCNSMDVKTGKSKALSVLVIELERKVDSYIFL